MRLKPCAHPKAWKHGSKEGKLRVFAKERIECVFVGLGHKENNIHVHKKDITYFKSEMLYYDFM